MFVLKGTEVDEEVPPTLHLSRDGVVVLGVIPFLSTPQGSYFSPLWPDLERHSGATAINHHHQMTGSLKEMIRAVRIWSFSFYIIP